MFSSIVRAMLGPFVVVLDWATAHPGVTASVIAVWASIWMWARLQQRRVERETTKLVIREAREAIAAKPNISAEDLYALIYPTWSEALPGWARVILHQWEVWPVPATHERVSERLDFSPEWIVDVLTQNGINLVGAKKRQKGSHKQSGQHRK